MNKRSEPPSEAYPDVLRDDEHLSDELLLLAADGELPPRISLQVKEHLEACWSCRSRNDAIEKCINDVVGYKSLFLASCTPPSEDGRARFLKLLTRRSQNAGRPRFWRRLAGFFHVPLFLRDRRYSALMYGLPVVFLAAVLFLQLRRVQTVSAGEMLSNAQDSEARALTSAARPVVYQKLRVRGEGHDVIRLSYHDVVGQRHADHFETDPEDSGASTPHNQRVVGAESAASGDEQFLESLFYRARLDWEDPLSVAHFRAWHDAYAVDDEIFHRDENSLTLRVRADAGPIAEAQFTVRRSDFHPVSEHIELRDAARLDVEEIGYEVMNLDAINDALFAPAPPVGPSAPVTRKAANADPSHNVPANLDDVEIQTRTVLHANGADLAEQIQITTTDRVTIRGVVSTDAKKMELQTALAKIPHVDAILQSPEPVETSQGAAALASVPEQTSAALPAPLEGLLETRFPDRLERESFVHQVLSLAQDSSDCAWALRRLAERYSPSDVAALKPESRRALETIARDDMAGLRYSSNMLRTILEGFFGGVASGRNEGADVDSLASDREPTSSPDAPPSWQEDAQQLFSTVDREVQITFQLMSGSESRSSSSREQDPNALTRAWLDVSAKLVLQTTNLSARLDGEFLSPSGGIQ